MYILLKLGITHIFINILSLTHTNEGYYRLLERMTFIPLANIMIFLTFNVLFSQIFLLEILILYFIIMLLKILFNFIYGCNIKCKSRVSQTIYIYIIFIGRHEI